MKRSDYAALIVLVLAVAAGTIAYKMFTRPHTPLKQDYSLPDDVFDEKTIGGVWERLYQYNVAGTPQNYEVYMLTGGLGLADPEVRGYDSQGNMEFLDLDHGIWYEIHESTNFNGTRSDWIKEHTNTGQVYFKLNDPRQAPQYFFNVREHRDSACYSSRFRWGLSVSAGNYQSSSANWKSHQSTVT